jgi:tRNA-specific 2-thiouridylase
VPDGDYGAFIEKRTGPAVPGPILDTDGKMLGTHRGIPFYTIGQRGGLGLAAHRPLYVVQIDAEKNVIIVGEKESLKARALICSDLNLLVDKLPERLTAKIRYSRKEAYAQTMAEDETSMTVVFDEPQEAITPGQAVVFYQDDIVLGGAMIEGVLDGCCKTTNPFPPTKGVCGRHHGSV